MNEPDPRENYFSFEGLVSSSEIIEIAKEILTAQLHQVGLQLNSSALARDCQLLPRHGEHSHSEHQDRHKGMLPDLDYAKR